MLAYLKIKIASLAAEAVLIRNEENRYRFKTKTVYSPAGTYKDVTPRAMTPLQTEIFWGLRNHRKIDVASESRSALIAYGYLRGRSYFSIEAKPRTEPDWTRVRELVTKYGKKTGAGLTWEAIDAWRKVPPTNAELSAREAARETFFKNKAARARPRAA